VHGWAQSHSFIVDAGS